MYFHHTQITSLILIYSIQYTTPKICHLQTFKTCEDAAIYFQQTCYPDMQDFNQNAFCQNFENLKHMSRKQLKQLSITEYFGYNLSLLQNKHLNDIENFNNDQDDEIPQIKLKQSQSTNYCQNTMCLVTNITEVKDLVYDQLDLRELNLISKNPKNNNQRQCGSCAYYATRRMIENMLLRINSSLANIDISVQFLMSNSFGKNQYCDGTNCFTILNYLSQLSPYKTLQTWDDLSYQPYKYEKQWKNHQYVKPNTNSLAYKVINNTLPWKQFKYNNTSNLTRIFFRIKKDDFIKQAKSVLNSGIVIAVNIQVDPLDFMFSFYNGRSVLSKQFQHNSTNHQVVLVGYTIKDGEECWIILNSHGDNWGDNGFGYIRMGHNDYNLEQVGYYIISDSDIVQQQHQLQNSIDENIRITPKQATTINLKQILNPGYQLVENNGIPNYQHSLVMKYIIIIVIVSILMILTLILQIYICILRKQQKSDQLLQI